MTTETPTAEPQTETPTVVDRIQQRLQESNKQQAEAAATEAQRYVELIWESARSEPDSDAADRVAEELMDLAASLGINSDRIAADLELAAAYATLEQAASPFERRQVDAAGSRAIQQKRDLKKRHEAELLEIERRIRAMSHLTQSVGDARRAQDKIRRCAQHLFSPAQQAPPETAANHESSGATRDIRHAVQTKPKAIADLLDKHGKFIAEVEEKTA